MTSILQRTATERNFVSPVLIARTLIDETQVESDPFVLIVKNLSLSDYFRAVNYLGVVAREHSYTERHIDDAYSSRSNHDYDHQSYTVSAETVQRKRTIDAIAATFRPSNTNNGWGLITPRAYFLPQLGADGFFPVDAKSAGMPGRGRIVTDHQMGLSIETPIKFMDEEFPVTHEYLMAALTGNAALRKAEAQGGTGSHTLLTGTESLMERVSRFWPVKWYDSVLPTTARLSVKENMHYTGV